MRISPQTLALSALLPRRRILPSPFPVNRRSPTSILPPRPHAPVSCAILCPGSAGGRRGALFPHQPLHFEPFRVHPQFLREKVGVGHPWSFGPRSPARTCSRASFARAPWPVRPVRALGTRTCTCKGAAWCVCGVCSLFLNRPSAHPGSGSVAALVSPRGLALASCRARNRGPSPKRPAPRSTPPRVPSAPHPPPAS